MYTSNTRKLVITALAVTLVTIVTIAIQIPNSVGGYINLGDSMIFALAIVGGPIIAGIAGGLGSALADILSGYAVWALPSFLIKGVEGLVAGALIGRISVGSRKPISLGTVLVLVVSGLVMVMGYFATSYILYGFPAALAAVTGDLIQAFTNVPIGIALAVFLNRAGAERYIK